MLDFHELLGSSQVQIAARVQVPGLQRTEFEIWGLEPQFLISSGHSACTGLFRAAGHRLTWDRRPRRCELRVTIERFAAQLEMRLRVRYRKQ